jgi:hypothetical protein
MPKIPEFDAGSGKLTPSDLGAQSLAHAGQSIARMAHVAGEASRQTGEAFKQGIDALGAGIGKYEEKAQAHTDAMAETDFDAQMIASTTAAKGAITEGGTPTTPQGEPITTSVGGVGGFTGDKGLPDGTKVPSPGSFAVVADNTITQHAQAGTSFIERLSGQAVSQKMQDHLAEKQQKYNAELAVHAAKTASEVAATHVVTQTDNTLRGLLSDTNQNPDNLEVNLQHGKDQFQTLRGHATGEYVGPMEKHATEGEEKFREEAIIQAAQGSIRKGGSLEAATKIIDTYPKDVKNRDNEISKLTTLQNQQSANVERQQRQQDREQAVKIDGSAATAYESSKLTSTDPKYVKDPYAEVRKQFHGDDLIKAETEIQHLQKLETHPIDKSVSDSTEMDIQKRIDDGSLNKEDAEKEADNAYKGDTLDRQGVDRVRKAASSSETSDGKFVKEQRIAFIKQYESWFNGPKMASGLFNSEEGAGAARLAAIKLENSIGPDGKPLGRSIYDQDSPNYIGRKNPTDPPSQFMQDHKMGMIPKINQGLANAGLDKKPGAPAVTPDKDELGRIGGPTAAPVKMPMSLSLVTTEGRAASITNMIKTYQPGTKVEAPNGTTYTIPPAGTTFQVEGKSYTVPGKAAAPAAAVGQSPPVPTANSAAPKNMSYTPETNSSNPAAAPGGVNGAAAGSAGVTGDRTAVPMQTYAAATIQIESGGRTGQRTGSYVGLGQFSRSEQRRLGITDPDNRAQVTAGLQREAAGFKPKLEAALGHEPQPADYYLAHQQGIGGAVAHLSQPDRPAYQSMASTGEGRQKGEGWAKRAIWGNMSPAMKANFPGGVTTVTSGDFTAMWEARYSRAVAQASRTRSVSI